MQGQFKTAHFWLSLGAIIIGATLASGLLRGHRVAWQIAGIAQTVLAAYGYQSGARWVPSGKAKSDKPDEITP